MADELHVLVFRLESSENLLDERVWSILGAQPPSKELMYERRWIKCDLLRVMHRKCGHHSRDSSLGTFGGPLEYQL